MRRFEIMLLACSASVGVMCGATSAGAAAADDHLRADTNTTVDTVVVTARKREERLIDVPVAASALSAKALARYQTSDLTFLAEQVPQLEIDQGSSGNRGIITLRGIGSTSVDAGIEQEVSVNIDGVPISRGSAIQEASFDQESVQVLKGPQALYFGKNSPAGVIVLTSEDPRSKFEGYARAGYELEMNQPYAEGAVSLPLTQTLSARVAVHFSDMLGGYIKDVAGPITDPTLLPLHLAQAGIALPGAPQRDYPGTLLESARLTLKYAPETNFEATLKVLASHYHDDGITQETVFFHCGGGRTQPTVLDFGGSSKYLTDPYGSCSPNGGVSSVGTVPAVFASSFPGSRGAVPFDNYDTEIASLVLNYHVSPTVLLTSVTGGYDIGETSFGVLDGTTYAEATGRNDDFNSAINEELRVVTSFSEPVNFSGGAFFEHADRSFKQNTMLGYLGIDPATGFSQYTSSADTFVGTTYSVYGELTWKILSNLELAGGARYSLEKKSGDIGNTYIFPGYARTLLPVATRLNPSLSDSNVSPQATLTWHPTADLMLYAAYKTGFKSGGIQTPTRYAATATNSNIVFRDETVKGGEVGLKLSALNGALTGDLTAYHYEYKGLQLTAYDVVTALFFTQNAGAASDDGIEGNMVYRLGPRFSLRGDLAYNRAKYTDFTNSQCYTGQTAATGCVGGVQDLSGTPLPRAPLWTGTIGGSWNTPLASGWNLGVDADLKFETRYQASTNYNPYSWQDGYRTVNASVRLFTPDWEFAVIGSNLGDTIYGVIKQDQVLGQAGNINGFIGPRRQISMQVTRHF